MERLEPRAMLVNADPVADAGGHYTIHEGDDLQLYFAGSFDPDGDPLTYSFSVDGYWGPGTTTTTSPGPLVAWSELAGTYGYTAGDTFTVGLQVEDGHGGIANDTATVEVLPADDGSGNGGNGSGVGQDGGSGSGEGGAGSDGGSGDAGTGDNGTGEGNGQGSSSSSGDGSNDLADLPGDVLDDARLVDLPANSRQEITDERIGDGLFGDLDVDLYEVLLDEGDVLVAEAFGADGLDPHLKVFDEAGTEFDAGDGLVFTTPLAGTYFVGVSDSANDAYDPFVAGSGTAAGTAAYTLSLLAHRNLPPQVTDLSLADVTVTGTTLDAHVAGTIDDYRIGGNVYTVEFDLDGDTTRNVDHSSVEVGDFFTVHHDDLHVGPYSIWVRATETDPVTGETLTGEWAELEIDFDETADHVPVARDDEIEVTAGKVTEIDAATLLANDSDPDVGDTLVLTGISDPQFGSANYLRFDIDQTTNPWTIDPGGLTYVWSEGRDTLTYTIEALEEDDLSASATLTILSDNDSIERATPPNLVLDDTIAWMGGHWTRRSGEIGGSALHGDRDVDLFEVELGVGELLELRFEEFDFDAFVRVFDAAGTELAWDDDHFDVAAGEFSLAPHLEFVAPTDGTYYVGVSSFENDTYDATSAGSGISGETGTYLAKFVVHHNPFNEIYGPDDDFAAALDEITSTGYAALHPSGNVTAGRKAAILADYGDEELATRFLATEFIELYKERGLPARDVGAVMQRFLSREASDQYRLVQWLWELNEDQSLGVDARLAQLQAALVDQSPHLLDALRDERDPDLGWWPEIGRAMHELVTHLPADQRDGYVEQGKYAILSNLLTGAGVTTESYADDVLTESSTTPGAQKRQMAYLQLFLSPLATYTRAETLDGWKDFVRLPAELQRHALENLQREAVLATRVNAYGAAWGTAIAEHVSDTFRTLDTAGRQVAFEFVEYYLFAQLPPSHLVPAFDAMVALHGLGLAEHLSHGVAFSERLVELAAEGRSVEALDVFEAIVATNAALPTEVVTAARNMGGLQEMAALARHRAWGWMTLADNDLTDTHALDQDGRVVRVNTNGTTSQVAQNLLATIHEDEITQTGHFDEDASPWDAAWDAFWGDLAQNTAATVRVTFGVLEVAGGAMITVEASKIGAGSLGVYVMATGLDEIYAGIREWMGEQNVRSFREQYVDARTGNQLRSNWFLLSADLTVGVLAAGPGLLRRFSRTATARVGDDAVRAAYHSLRNADEALAANRAQLTVFGSGAQVPGEIPFPGGYDAVVETYDDLLVLLFREADAGDFNGIFQNRKLRTRFYTDDAIISQFTPESQRL